MIPTIHKYALEIPHLELQVSADAKVLAVGVQQDSPVVWIQVSPEAPQVKELTFAVTGTGHVVPDGRYVGTFQIDYTGAPFVGHVFVRGE